MEQLLSRRMFTGALDTITAPIQTWLDNHPVFQWLAIHPLWLIGLVLLLIFMLSGLLGAIARLTEKIWLAILQLPFRITQWIWQKSFNFFSNTLMPKGSAAKASQTKQERVNDILNRLEAIRQEQEALLKEVKALLTLTE